jgi:multicomponent Na+:H+ antiporter subunit A
MIGPSSPVVGVGVRVVTPLALVVAAYLFFAGHNRPGGGFAAGLVLGAVVSLREVAGIRRPIDATRLLAAGGVIAGLVSIAPLFAGDVLLDQVVFETTVPILGKIKAGSSLVFDAGVTLVVVGLVVAVLEGLVGDQLADRSNRAPDAEGRS